MRVCFDTNTFIRLFSAAPEYQTIRRALIRGELTLLVSTEILMEYREVIERQRRFVTWARFVAVLERLDELGVLIEVSPQFRFSIVREDPDDDKFADCAIAGEAVAIVTYDPHFRSVSGSGYKPVAMTPEELARRLQG